MKRLTDLCLTCISRNLKHINRVSQFLATVHKELLLQRLSYHSMFTTEYLPYITYNLFCSTLKHISFARCSQITDAVLKQLGASGCKLQSISLIKCSKIGDAGLRYLTYDQPELETIELEHLTLTDRSLCDIRSNKLRKFCLHSVSDITGSGIRQITRRNPSISHMELRCSLEDEVFTHIAIELNANLIELDAGFVYTISDKTLTALGEHCPNINKLNIYGSSRVSHVGLQKLWNGCPDLQSVNVSYCTKLSEPVSAACLQTMPVSLRKLSLCGVGLREAHVLADALRRLPLLDSLQLSGVPAVNDDTMEMLLEDIGAHVEQFDVSGTVSSTLTDKGISVIIKYCTKLTSLGLGLLLHSNLTCAPIIPMLEGERGMLVKKLRLSVKHLSYNVLMSLPQCHYLDQIDLSGVSLVDDDLMEKLSENCRNLSYINIKACQQVTDTGVCAVAVACPLVYVVLSGIQNLTDRTMLALANCCPYLEEVFLNGCAKISTQAVNYLVDCCLTSVMVQHKVPNVNAMQVIARNLDTGEYCRIDQPAQ